MRSGDDEEDWSKQGSMGQMRRQKSVVDLGVDAEDAFRFEYEPTKSI